MIDHQRKMIYWKLDLPFLTLIFELDIGIGYVWQEILIPAFQINKVISLAQFLCANQRPFVEHLWWLERSDVWIWILVVKSWYLQTSKDVWSWYFVIVCWYVACSTISVSNSSNKPSLTITNHDWAQQKPLLKLYSPFMAVLGSWVFTMGKRGALG